VEVKEVVRAAQEAEVRRDFPRAVELLRRAGALYREMGNAGRADRMERHAERLEASSNESRGGPVAAAPELNAWCSFCCRPRAEAGPLVTGPTDAYLCRDCARDALRLLP
jgi:hypothetical protein